mmetsp:Transcript_30988/g.65323  ORF Transcript_30988/g.65323 Transcript_30988/m.65323 type:complete len:83 (-) Transcript_30988:700-948(-)|eukprot:6204950-Pleurochrysis_carterae.AAC.1
MYISATARQPPATTPATTHRHPPTMPYPYTDHLWAFAYSTPPPLPHAAETPPHGITALLRYAVSAAVSTAAITASTPCRAAV